MPVTLPPPPQPAGLPAEVYRWMYLAYTAINSIQASTGSEGTFGDPGINTPDAALVPNGSRAIDYLNLGTLALNSVEILPSGNEINELYGSNITTEDLQSLHGFSSHGHSVDFSIGAEAANLISVTIQVNDVMGVPMTLPFSGFMYLSDDPQGLSYTATPPDTSVASGAAGYILDITTAPGSKRIWNFITDSSGVLTFDITDTTATTWYLVVVLSYGELNVSDAITFA